MQQGNPSEVTVAESRIKMTAFLWICVMLPSSFMPEKTAVTWLLINSAFILIVLSLLYILWKKYKTDSIGYYSFQVYILLMGFVFFAITPLLKLVNVTSYFWLLILITIGFIVTSHVMKKRTTLSFVNRNHRSLAIIASLYMGILMIAGIGLSSMMQTTGAPENTGVSVLFYLVGVLFIVLAPMFLVSKTDVDRLAESN
jgi:hypothetical protein